MSDIDWEKAFIELVGYVDRYTNDGKNRFKYEGNDTWTDIYDGRPRHTDIMPSVLMVELHKGAWERKYK